MQTPEKGSKRRHYKSTGGSHHTYEVVGLAKHSETEDNLVVYKPLADSTDTWLGTTEFAVRPLSMRYDTIEWEGKVMPRFTNID